MTDQINGTVYSPWAKPFGKIPALARYQALTGLKPEGPHLSLASSLLKNITRKCELCGGTGLHGTYGGLGWRVCPVCHGFGETYAITLDELQALRKQLLHRYPDAAASNWRPGHPISCPVQERATSLVIDACPQTSSDPAQGELFPTGGGADETDYLPWDMCVWEGPPPELAPRQNRRT